MCSSCSNKYTDNGIFKIEYFKYFTLKNKSIIMSSTSTKPVVHEEEYICVTCGNKQTIKSTQPILCTHCHSRIFRKIRTPNAVQFLAR